MTPRVLVAGAAAAVVLVAGCGGGGSASSKPAPSAASAFRTAQSELDKARAAALTDVKTVTDTASAIDAMEPAAGKGDVDAMRTLAPAAKAASAAAAPVIARLGTDADAYSKALTDIETASAAFSGRAASAVAHLLVTARAEASATRSLATSFGGSTGWPGYQALEDAGQLWLTRAVAGYYPDPAKGGYSSSIAGNNFLIMLEPKQTAISTDRAALAKAVGSFDTAATQKALTAVTAALNG